MLIIDRCIDILKARKKRIEDGLINCIPLPFPRFRAELPGIERGRYILISGITKAGKTQLTNYLIIYNTIFYVYENPGKIHPKIFYYNLEETKEDITFRFMSYVLYRLSNGKVHISPTDLKSTDERKPLSQSVIDLLESDAYKEVFKLYEDIVEFKDSKNPTGIWKDMNAYGKEHYTPVYKETTVPVKDSFEEVRPVDHWVPNDPESYIFFIVDHVSLLDTERGMTTYECIAKLSEYCIALRNKYEMIPVVVQQQSTETSNLEAFKQNKIRPTKAGLSDCKSTGNDANLFLGITNPYSFEIPQYQGYDIRRLQDKARFMEVVLNRNGRANGICPLYFDGSVCYYKELPQATDTPALQKVYDLISNLDKFNVTLMVFSLKKWIKSIVYNKQKE